MILGTLANLRQSYSFVYLLYPFVGLLGSWLCFSSELRAQTLSQWSFNPNTYQLRFTTQSEPDPFVLKNPTRIVIDLPNTAWEGKTVAQHYSGLVTAVRIGQFQADITRIVLELSPEAKLLSPDITPEKKVTAQGEQWQLTLNLKKVHFPLSQLLQIPPVISKPSPVPATVEVPPPPITQKWLSPL